LRKEVLNRRYDLSAAMYLDICDKSQFVWIFTNKQKGYHWTATVLASAEILERGRTQYLEYKRKIAESYNSGIWPKPQSIQSKKNLETGKLELPSI
jgi:exodeoxyribonuclease VIII